MMAAHQHLLSGSVFERTSTGSGFVIQIGLATYWTLATLLSPWLCCCPSACVATPVAGQCDASPTHGDDCCRCQRDSGDVVTGASPLQQDDPSDGHPCPVKQYRAQPVVASDSSGLATSAASWVRWHPAAETLEHWANFVQLTPQTAVQEEAWEPTGFPFLTGRGILRMLSILRC